MIKSSLRARIWSKSECCAKYPISHWSLHLPRLKQLSTPVISLPYKPQSPEMILPCPVLESFELISFYEHLFVTNQPVLIKNGLTEWPALQRWADLRYFLEIAGERLVPVELGSSYLSVNSGVRLMTLQEFIAEFILAPKAGEIGYLAQHSLFDQIRALREDLIIPDHCSLLLPNDEESGEFFNVSG